MCIDFGGTGHSNKMLESKMVHLVDNSGVIFEAVYN